MKRIIALAAVSALALQPVAHAAYIYEPQVSVYTSSTFDEAYGSIGGAINGPGILQFIGCQNGANAAGNYTYLFCQAEDASGASLGCYYLDPPEGLIQAAASINMQSYIAFSANPSTGECTDLTVETGSQFYN
ncbi:MAG: hypothetical protein ABSD02_22850 [Steroidobacteraceae bacterium]|jgi:hypothetical protein